MVYGFISAFAKLGFFSPLEVILGSSFPGVAFDLLEHGISNPVSVLILLGPFR